MSVDWNECLIINFKYSSMIVKKKKLLSVTVELFADSKHLHLSNYIIQIKISDAPVGWKSIKGFQYLLMVVCVYVEGIILWNIDDI